MNGTSGELKMDDRKEEDVLLPTTRFNYINTSGFHYNDTPYVPQTTSYSSATTTSTADNRYEYRRGFQNTSPPCIDKAPLYTARSSSDEQDNFAQNGDRPSPSNTPPEDKHVWSKAEVELLLDLYEKNQEQLKDPRVRKTRVWEDIARLVREKLESDVNGCQCNQKFRNLKADFQKVQEHNGRPGNFKRICKYYDRLANLLNTNMYNQRPYQNGNSFVGTIDSSSIFYENGRPHSQLSILNKRKFSSENVHESSFPVPKKMRVSCECSEELAYLRDAIERTNHYIIARAAHEDERIRRLEDMHREKLIAMSRFADIFKDYIHKIV